MGGFWQDVRYAGRMMLKTRGLSAVAVATLALGIGANTAIFSVVNGILLRPLPYREPDRLVMVWQDLRARGGPATEWSGPSQQVDWKADTDVFENLASVQGWTASLGGGEMPESLQGEQTTYEYFDVLGVRPALGRVFRDTDDVRGAPRVVVLSHGLWRRRFGSDPAVVGRSVPINGESHEIIGVMPDGFRPVLATGAAMWRPMQMNRVNPARNAAVYHTVGRIRTGLPIDQAQAGLAALAGALERAHPDTDAKRAINAVPLLAQQTLAMRTPLWLLQAAVGFVLLIACVNIANLQLSRASGRTREIAVRRALGADRARIVRQLLTESLALSGCGCALGVLVGDWGLSILRRVAPEGTPRIDEVSIDGRVLLFALALALLTAVLFGLVPAAHAARERVAPTLRLGGRGQLGDGGQRIRRGLVVAELTLALVLLAGGGLLVRTFVALQRADLGFTPDRILTGFILPPQTLYKTDAARRAFYDAVIARTAALPGVQIAALSSVLPLSGDSDEDFLIEGRPEPTRGEALTTWYRVVSATYFAAMQIPLQHGRLFVDREAAPVVVISETMAKRHWPGRDPVGTRIRFGDVWATIVGVVDDVKVRGPREPGQVETYIPYWLNPEAGINVVLKTAGDPRALAEPLRRAVKEVDPGIAVASLATMDETIADSVGSSRFVATLAAVFGVLALLLAAVGIYGVMSYAVSQRTQEIGVRLALGAQERQIFALVVGESMKLAGAGLTLGLAGAVVAGRAMRGMLFGVGATDARTLAATAAVLAAVTLAAAYVPARRAMGIEPQTALRAD
ncbi:MAG TPA: ABC transporter permease [Vicinamibacterales bacterium]